MKKTNTNTNKNPKASKRPREEEEVEDDSNVQALLEAQEREEQAQKQRAASDKFQSSVKQALKSFESGRAVAKTDTLNVPVLVLSSRERDQSSRNTLVSVLVPSCVSRMVGIPTHSSSSGKERHTRKGPNGSLVFSTFVSEKSQKEGAVATDVSLVPRTVTSMGIPDVPGTFPLGEPLQLYDISAMSYIKKGKKDEAGNTPVHLEGTETVKYGPGAPIVPSEKPVQGNSISSPSGLQNILLAGKTPLKKLSFQEQLIMWASLGQTTVDITPVEVPKIITRNVLLIPTGPEIYKMVYDLTGVSLLPTRIHEYGPDEGKGVQFDSCALPLAMDPTRNLRQIAYGRLYQMQNQKAHLESVAANEKDPSVPIVPIGASVAVAGYGEFMNWFGIDSFSSNTARWSQTLLNCMHRANGFIVCRIDWEKSVKRAQALNESSLVQTFNPTAFVDENGESAPAQSTDAGSKLIQPLVTNALAVVQDWRTLVMELGIRIQPGAAHDMRERLNTENRDMVTSKHQPVSTERLISMYLGQGLVPLFTYTGRTDSILRCLPIKGMRAAKVKGEVRQFEVWTPPENPKYNIEYRVLSPTVLKLPNPKSVVAEVNSAKPVDSGARFLDAMTLGSTITGEEATYSSNPVVGEAIKSLREQRILPIDTAENLVLFAVLVDKPDAKEPTFSTENSIRPEVLAVVNNITGPLCFGDALKKKMATHPDRKLLNSHGSNLLPLLSASEDNPPAAKRAKKAPEPEPEPEPESGSEEMEQEGEAESEDGEDGDPENETGEEEGEGEGEEEDEGDDEDDENEGEDDE
ncbi:MAG: hypothetical protein AB7P49_04605 [Bdellovibrionales bacterium]